MGMDFWYLHESYTFVKLQEGSDSEAIEEQFINVAEKFKTRETLKEHTWAIDFVPMADIHLNPAKPYEIEAKGNRKAVQFLLLISFVILIIAWINYVNLSTAQSMGRAREVGVRKVSGSHKSQLISQFLIESAFVNILAGIMAFCLSIVIAWLLPNVLGINVSIGLTSDPTMIFIFMGMIVVGTFISGMYPALILSAFRPVEILKGKFSGSNRGTLLRQSLVVIQFGITIILIGSTLVASRQIEFMRQQDLGIEIDQTIAIEAPTRNEDYQNKLQSFKQSIRSLAGVEAVTSSGSVPGKEVAKFLANRREYAPPEDQKLFEMLMVDFDYISAYGLELVAGRDFDKNMPTDSIALILNQAAVALFGFESDEAAIDERIILEVTPGKRNHIIGVVKNYHQQSLQKDVTPIILFMDPDYSWIPITYFSVKVNTNQIEPLLASIEEKWDFFFPESSFDHFFLDEFFDRQYQADRQYGTTFTVFSLLAIVIACMGLFGLTLFTSTNRLKEIGVRKVLGASVPQVVGLLNVELLKLLLISGLLGVPLMYFLVGRWLDGYAYKVGLDPWVFAIPVLIVLIIAVVSTSYLTIKAARTNPATTLKYE